MGVLPIFLSQALFWTLFSVESTEWRAQNGIPLASSWLNSVSILLRQPHKFNCPETWLSEPLQSAPMSRDGTWSIPLPFQWTKPGIKNDYCMLAIYKLKIHVAIKVICSMAGKSAISFCSGFNCFPLMWMHSNKSRSIKHNRKMHLRLHSNPKACVCVCECC